MRKTKDDNVYLDYAASTPVRDEVLKAMQPYWQDDFANPQSSHTHGRQAQDGLQEARELIADTLSVQPNELVFTSGATEANSLAIQGRLQQEKGGVAVVSAGSHPSLLKTDSAEAEIKKLPLQASGRIDLSALESVVTDDTAVVSVPYVNSAVGAIEPLREISNQLKNIPEEDQPTFHTDASQAGNFLPLEPEPLGVDMMTINSHKLYGPKGVGLLWVRSGTRLSSVLLSNNEHAVGDYQILRPGTPPVPLIVGFAKALKIAQENHKQATQEVSDLRDYAIDNLLALPADITLNGSRKQRVANNIHISIADTNHDYLATQLDQEGISVATTTACQSSESASVMLAKLPKTPDTGLRITLGLQTNKQAIDRFIAVLEELLSESKR